MSDAAIGGKDALAGEKVVSAICAAGELRIPLGELVDVGIARFATGEVELSDETYAA